MRIRVRAGPRPDPGRKGTDTATAAASSARGPRSASPLQQHVAPQRVAHGAEGRRRVPFAQPADDVSEVAGLAGVVGPGQAVRLSAASPEVHDRSPPAASGECSEQALHVSGAARALEPVQDDDDGAGVAGPVDVEEVPVGKLEAFPRQGDGARAPEERRPEGLRMRSRQPPCRREVGGGDGSELVHGLASGLTVRQQFSGTLPPAVATIPRFEASPDTRIAGRNLSGLRSVLRANAIAERKVVLPRSTTQRRQVRRLSKFRSRMPYREHHKRTNGGPKWSIPTIASRR